MTTIEETVACGVCREPVAHERVEQGLKTCGSRCQGRFKNWKDPLHRREGQLLMAAGGPTKVLWNDAALQERLGTDRAGASQRLEALARAKGLELAWGKEGLIRFAARVTPERRARFLLQREVRPDGRGGSR